MSFRSYGPGRYLAGQEGFEPSTNRLTADRTTSVLLTLNAKSPKLLTRGFDGHSRNQYCVDSCKPLSLRWLEYQTMRRRYQLGGSVVRSASFSSPPRSFAFDVRAYSNYASSKLVFKSFLQVSLFSIPSSAINVKKTAELNNSMHQRTRSMHCFSVKKGAW